MGSKCWKKISNWRLLVDVLLYISVLIPVLACYANMVPPMAGHFRCDDPSIRFPYQGDTVSTKILLSMVLIPMLVIVFATELSQAPQNSCIVAAKRAAVSTGQVFIRFWVSLTFNIAINMALKTLTAVPRPHFIATCLPRWDMLNCSAHRGNVNIDLSLCRGFNDDPDSVSDAIKSFPSGHAQMSCFAAAFTIVYLSMRLETSKSCLLRYWLQLVLVVMAIFSSTSRVADHRHHVMDIVVGGAIGVVIGVTAALQHVFPQSDSPEDEKAEKENIEKQASKLRLISTEFGIGTVTNAVKDEKPNPGS